MIFDCDLQLFQWHERSRLRYNAILFRWHQRPTASIAQYLIVARYNWSVSLIVSASRSLYTLSVSTRVSQPLKSTLGDAVVVRFKPLAAKKALYFWQCVGAQPSISSSSMAWWLIAHRNESLMWTLQNHCANKSVPRTPTPRERVLPINQDAYARASMNALEELVRLRREQNARCWKGR